MNSFLNRCRTVKRLLQERGPAFTLQTLGRRLITQLDHLVRHLEGRWIEITGNKVTLDGLVFDLSAPEIRTDLKSYFSRGEYEVGERRLAIKYLPRDIPLIELGGCVGVVACLINRLLHDPQQHWVLEANPAMCAPLKVNRERNRACFQVVNTAIAYAGQFVDFEVNDAFVGSKVSQSAPSPSVSTLRVPATTLQALASELCLDTFNILCDIEGIECELIANEALLLKTSVRWIVMEEHPRVVSNQELQKMHTTLNSAGFVPVETCGDVVAYRNTHFTKDPTPDV
jgi:FkbM family methyltransferase